MLSRQIPSHFADRQSGAHAGTRWPMPLTTGEKEFVRAGEWLRRAKSWSLAQVAIIGRLVFWGSIDPGRL